MFKRLLYVTQILICTISGVLTVWNWHMFYREDFAARDAFFHIPALLAYGMFSIYRIKELFAEYEKLSKNLTIKLCALLFGCISILIVPTVFFWFGLPVALCLLCISVVVLFASVKMFKRKTYIKLYMIFLILAIMLAASQIICGFMEASPMDLQSLSKAQQDFYYLKEAVKSIGGTATFCWMPLLIVFWLSDVFTNEIILEAINEDPN